MEDTTPGRSPISVAWHPGPFQARRQSARDLKRKKEKSNASLTRQRQIARMVVRVRDVRQGGRRWNPWLATWFSLLFRFRQSAPDGWDENATRRATDQTETRLRGSRESIAGPTGGLWEGSWRKYGGGCSGLSQPGGTRLGLSVCPGCQECKDSPDEQGTISTALRGGRTSREKVCRHGVPSARYCVARAAMAACPPPRHGTICS
jgi:hypothetical protein